jgi:hypothetical protein
MRGEQRFYLAAHAFVIVASLIKKCGPLLGCAFRLIKKSMTFSQRSAFIRFLSLTDKAIIQKTWLDQPGFTSEQIGGLIPVYRKRHARPNFGSQDRHAAGLRAGQL